MKISNSKKELARIISENGGWRDGNYAVQDKDDKKVWFMRTLAGRPDGAHFWPGVKSKGIPYGKVLPNWHQTVLSRAEYFHLYPAPDADGWIEWKGGECPVGEGVLIDAKKADGSTELAIHDPEDRIWGDTEHLKCIIAYRLHKQEQPKPEFCESVMRSIPEPEAQPTIEQLAADYRNAKECAGRKQQEADAAKADAEAKLAELVAAGKALGLVLSVAEPEPELVITDWLDLLVGDEVALTSPNGGGVNVGEVGVIRRIDGGCMSVNFPSQTGHLISRAIANWKFIRRP